MAIIVSHAAYARLRKIAHETGADVDMTRAACKRWLAERQYRMPHKSSCIFCPFRTGPQWLDMQANEPDDFEDACRWDEAFRELPENSGQAFVHRSMTPLRTADFRHETHPDQLGFALECDACGL